MNNAQTINDLIMKCAEYKKDAEYLAGERDYWKQQAQRNDSVTSGCDTNSNRTCSLAYDGKWLTCSNCGESLQWFGVRTVYKGDTQERALGVDGVRYCPFCGARIEMDGESE